MPSEIVLYGPESEAANTYSAVTPVPGVGGSGGAPSFRHVRPLGTQLVMQDGRKFRFAVASSGAALVVGNVLTAGVATASQQNLTAAAAVVGDRILTMTTGASTAQNVFAEGFVGVSVTPGLGDIYKIASHLVFTSGAGDVVNLWPGQSVRTALTTSSRLDLTDNVYSRVIQSPATTVASAMVGVGYVIVAASKAGWIQTRGPAIVLTSGTAIAGDRVSTGLGAGGAAGPNAAIATQPDVALCIFAAASGAGSTVFLQIDG